MRPFLCLLLAACSTRRVDISLPNGEAKLHVETDNPGGSPDVSVTVSYPPGTMQPVVLWMPMFIPISHRCEPIPLEKP